MKKIYQIDGRHQVRSFSNGLKILPYFPLALAIGYFLGYTNSFLDPDFLTILICWNLLFFVPAFILHFIYFFYNRNTKLEIERENQTITITNTKGKHHFNINEIKKVERVIYGDYRHPEHHQNWIPMPWRNYGYLKLITKDDKVFLLTSLLLDPLNPPIQLIATKYSFIPILEKGLEEELTREELEEYQREEIEAFKVKFQNHTEEELNKKTVANGFRKEAAIAAKELLKEKNDLPS